MSRRPTPPDSSSKRQWVWIALLTTAVPLLSVAAWVLFAEHPAPTPLTVTPAPIAHSPVPTFVDEQSCARCHTNEAGAWTDSQHAHAMQHADSKTVLGRFDGASVRNGHTTTRFTTREGRYFVSLDGPDGKPGEYEVKYTFGVAPLQQYLVELTGGRMQALTVAWDTKAKRWFDLHPGEHIDHRDVLHWTKTSQNWNTMCAACHSTDVKKNYDVATNSYRTTFHQINVGCQACHGPGSNHLEWADTRVGSPPSKGFVVNLRESSKRQEENCARCHSLRSTLTAEDRVGDRFLDHALPVMLGGSEYFPDGQQREEVFVYGSWIQSRMHQKGVRCTDCHDAHSGELRAPGNATCTSCHNTTGPAAGPHVDTSGLQRKNYDSPEHHHHQEAISCVSCHAPKRTYMVNDPRLDHSFRIPRPDLSEATQSPNACNGCHSEKSAKWAADAVARWYGPGRRQEAHYGLAFAAAERGQPGAAELLQRVITDASQPPFVRAGALEQLARYPGQRTETLIAQAITDPDPFVRLAAVHAAEGAGPETAAKLSPLLSDPLRAVRVEAARTMAPAWSWMGERRPAWEAAATEYEAALRENADRPQSWLGLAQLAIVRGDLREAERRFRQAILLEPSFVPAYVNASDFLRQSNREAEDESLLREGLRRVPGNPQLNEALALSLVRQARKTDALKLLAEANRRPDATSRLAFLYGVSLADSGKLHEAIRVLAAAADRQGDRDVLLALASYQRQAGNVAGIRAALTRLAAMNPGDPALAGPTQ